jgi:NCAIR mutase (PurE)-related protein
VNNDIREHDATEQLELLSRLIDETQSEHSQTRQTQQTYQGNISQQSEGVVNTGTPTIETRPDPGREWRKGVPEVIFAETKDNTQVVSMARGLLNGSGRAIISRLRPEAIPVVKAAFVDYSIHLREASRAMVIYAPGYKRLRTGGHVGVISAGTSDIPIADEASLIAEEMGCRVTSIYDVGVAGLHRLVTPLRNLLADNVDVIIVAAGMDGALPSVVTGLVPVPVIGLPTSIGYGMGGKGVAALLSMLQTCAPGLSVVNIDNGVGAGSTAALIANRIALARKQREQESQ